MQTGVRNLQQQTLDQQLTYIFIKNLKKTAAQESLDATTFKNSIQQS